MLDITLLPDVLDRAARRTGIALPFAVEAVPGEGLAVDWDGGPARIAAEDTAALTRGVFRLTRAVREGSGSLHLRERRHFAHCGAMLDMSRNGVMTVPALKDWIDRQALLGLNLLMLYTEDTYEVPGYPYFGYLRGRYTQAELRELDDYAARTGVELVPCVQTLGHLKQFLQWPSSAGLRDQPDILLIDSEPTYDFLDAALRSLRSCFRTDRIHIGMDEAHGVGLGVYLLRHGYTDRFALLNRHLARVSALCEKYGFRPMMWSDMFFRLGSARNEYYDEDIHVPDSVIAAIPPVEQVYWDYYHKHAETYERMLAEHSRMNRGTVFAGGVWSWSGFLPNRERTLRTMEPALRVNARRDTDTVLATFWGDDGAETDYHMALERLPLFSEACWAGPDFDTEDCDRAADCLTGLPRSFRQLYGRFYADDFEAWTGKKLMWCDPLYPCGEAAGTLQTLRAAAEEARAAIDRLPEIADRTEVRYTRCVFDTLAQKTALLLALRPAYEAGSRGELRALTEGAIPALAEAYSRQAEAHRALWESRRKRQGWEVLALRYGGAVGRLHDAADELSRYLRGELPGLQELDEPALPDGKGFVYDRSSTPSAKT